MEKGKFPICVFVPRDESQDDTFRTAKQNVVLDINTFVEEQPDPEYSQGDPFLLADLILDRIEGDWTAQSVGTGPTYGFHRWTPDITASGYACDSWRMTSCTPSHDEGVLHFVQTFEFFVTKAGA